MPAIFKQPTFLLALAAVLAGTLGGCPLFTQETKRDVQAVWSNDDSSILIAQSSYQTSSPSEPYFNTTHATGWKTGFYQASASDLSNRTLLAELVDPAQPGGQLQYQAMYWFGAKGSIIVAAGDSPPYAIFVKESARKVRFNVPPDFQDYLDSAVKTASAQELAPLDTIPSPNGDLTAVLWQIAYDAGTNPLVPDLRFDNLLSFYLTRDGTPRRRQTLPFPCRQRLCLRGRFQPPRGPFRIREKPSSEFAERGITLDHAGEAGIRIESSFHVKRAGFFSGREA